MKKQFILIGAGAFVLLILFYFGKTVADKKPMPEAHAAHPVEKTFDIQGFLEIQKAKLTPSQSAFIVKTEQKISNTDVIAEKIKGNEDLAAFWKDSINAFEPYAFYISAAAKLDNSEKNLTFAARLFSENLRAVSDEARLGWETTEAIDLYERAIKLNPNNDDLHLGLGSCYIYGRTPNGGPQETMNGIREVLTVVRKDSTNMKAQFLAGVGGFVSGQYDKAAERLKKVVAAQPDNVEAVSFLADTYAAQGNKAEAVKWYTISKRMMNNAEYSREVDERIKLIK